jgi:hypothetical protein
MKRLSRCSAAFFVVSLVASSTSPALAIIRPMDGGGGNLNLSGMYSGSVSDSVLGTGTAVANLAHSGGNGGGDPFGGWLAFTFGSTTYSNPTSASRRGQGEGGDVRFMDGGGNNTVHGAFVSIIGSVACTFHFTATFNPSSFQLSGQYHASNGCSGETGTFMLTQLCFYHEAGHMRRDTGSGPGLCT